MPYTARASAALAQHLLAQPNADLRRRLSVLRRTPFPPGSRSLAADASWYRLAQRVPHLRGFVYGTDHDALVYTYDAARQLLVIHFAIIDGSIVPEPDQ